MGIDICWYDDDQALLQITMSAPWDWPDFERAMQQGLEMITPVGHVVHFLINFTGSTRPPKGNSLMYLKRVMQRMSAHPLAGETYLINPNPFARSLIDMLLRVYKEAQYLHVVRSQEEALRCIEAFVEEKAGGQ